MKTKKHNVGLDMKHRELRTRTSSQPTIGVGEDEIKGRGPGGKIPALGVGDLGESIPQSQRDAAAIARIDQAQTIEGGPGDFDGELPD